MYLEITSEGLGRSRLVVGPFADETARSEWKKDFWKKFKEKEAQTEAKLDAQVTDSMELPSRNFSGPSLLRTDDIIGEIFDAAD